MSPDVGAQWLHRSALTAAPASSIPSDLRGRRKREERMTTVATRPGTNGRSRPSLGDPLDRLDGILNGLADALNESVTPAVSAAVGKAVREAIEGATREMAARPLPPATPTGEADVNLDRRLGRGTLGRLRAA